MRPEPSLLSFPLLRHLRTMIQPGPALLAFTTQHASEMVKGANSKGISNSIGIWGMDYFGRGKLCTKVKAGFV